MWQILSEWKVNDTFQLLWYLWKSQSSRSKSASHTMYETSILYFQTSFSNTVKQET